VAATTAVESVAARSRTTPERNDRRSVPMVVRRYRSVTSRIPVSWALPRLKARRLGRPRTTSRNQPDSPARASKLARARAPADRPMGAMNTGITGRVTAMSSAEVRSTAAVQHSTATGPPPRGPPGQVAGEVDLQAGDPLDGGGGQLGALVSRRPSPSP
jgi:hypothetical protein